VLSIKAGCALRRTRQAQLAEIKLQFIHFVKTFPEHSF